MYQSNVKTNPARHVLRWTARVVSVLFIGIYALMLMSQGIDISEMNPREWLSLFFFPFGATVGMILAWWQEGIGGAITIVCVFVSVLVQDSTSGGGYMLTCASPGLLFLFSWVLSLSTAHLNEDLAAASRKEK
jgi:hypothetical protein